MKQRKNYHMPSQSELLSLFWSTLAARFGIPKHTLLTRALKKGLPEILAALEEKHTSTTLNTVKE